MSDRIKEVRENGQNEMKTKLNKEIGTRMVQNEKKKEKSNEISK